MSFEPVGPDDVHSLREFLREVDLTLSGLDAPTVLLWAERDVGP
ncbi:MAG TPA: hypothetical protein VGN33_07790 [Leifsonia sp.]|jgi:hypothetical protein|nr:hypothetical protein [Leifsonia sp.]